MRILSIDTSSTRGSLALSENTTLVIQEQLGIPRTHSEHLIPSIDALLTKANWERTSLEGIVVAMGPGSFMGLRIGLATAKGIALAVECPIVGISSLASLSLNGRYGGGAVIALIDARRGEVYTTACQFLHGEVQKFFWKESLFSPPDLIQKLGTVPGEMLLVGDGVITYGTRIKKEIGKRVTLAEGTTLLPQAINLALLALPRLQQGKGDDLASLLPNYIRQSDAEIGFQGKKKL